MPQLILDACMWAVPFLHDMGHCTIQSSWERIPIVTKDHLTTQRPHSGSKQRIQLHHHHQWPTTGKVQDQTGSTKERPRWTNWICRLQKAMELSREKGASTWLSTLPLTKNDFSLHKSRFHNALGYTLHVQLGCSLSILAKYGWGKQLQHERNITASLIMEVQWSVHWIRAVTCHTRPT